MTLKLIFKRIFPSDEGIFPYLYLANLFIPLYFMLQEPPERLYPGLLLLAIFVVLYRQVFWSQRYTAYFVIAIMIITIVFGNIYNPMYIYIIFVFAAQIVRLPIKWMYGLCGGFTVFTIYLIYQTVIIDPFYIVTLLPPLFGGSILPFIMKNSLRHKELNEELKALASKLEKKNQEMILLEESKKRMLADLSHDLKTPMTTIQGYSKALYEDIIVDEEKKKKYLKYIYDKSIRVTHLIEELFMFSKLDSPDSPIQKEEKDICEFFREVIVEYYELFSEKDMELEVEIPPTVILYSFDQKLLYRAISNILENVVKYNPTNTFVYFHLHNTNTSIKLEIGDNGVGISEEIVNTLFDPFVRGDKNRLNDGGTGLGLAITKKIVEKHGGQLKLETKPARGKTNFIIELPK
jgi:signal transduction histidine kinase